MTTFRSSPAQRPSKKNYKGYYPNKKWVKKGNTIRTSGRHFHQSYDKLGQHNDDTNPQHDVLLHRLSLPSVSPTSSSGGLLGRIASPIGDNDVASGNMTDDSDEDRNANTRVSPEGLISFSASPHYHTPDPAEVERFLQSVIGAPPAPPSPPSMHACSDDSKPTFDPSANYPQVKIESPAQTTISLPLSHTPDHYRPSPPLDNTMAPPSTSALEACRNHLVPVVLSCARARDPETRLDSEQCAQLLSDDRCRDFLRLATAMRHQNSSLVSQTRADQDRAWSLKRDRVDEADTCGRNTRSRLDSVNTVVSSASRRNSDTTLVEFPGGRTPPKAPRAMLQVSQAPFNNAQGWVPTEHPLRVVSPTTDSDGLVVPVSPSSAGQRALEMVSSPVQTSGAGAGMAASGPSIAPPTGGPTHDPSPLVSPPHSAAELRAPDFTQPGTWFKRQGSKHAEIVDVDIEVNAEMFYLSCDREPFRLRMRLSLRSAPVNTTIENGVNNAVDRHTLQWPPRGKLVVQVNPESERNKTWLPYVLESNPLDVTPCIRPGKNTFRFIQLADLSEFAFALVAASPSPEDEWRNWDWTSCLAMDRAAKIASMPADDAMGSLSEFACLPVTVRS